MPESSLQVPCLDTDEESGNRSVSERYVHREAERKLEKMEAKGRLPSEKPVGLPQGGSPTYAPTLGSLTYPLRGQEAPPLPSSRVPKPLTPWHQKGGAGGQGKKPTSSGVRSSHFTTKLAFLPYLIIGESSNLPLKCSDTKKFLHVSIHSPVHTSGGREVALCPVLC